MTMVATTTTTTTTTDEDFLTRLIEATTEKAAVFIVKDGAGCIDQVLQDVGFSAEESKDRKFNKKSIRGYNFEA